MKKLIPRCRKMTWVLFGWCTLILVWAIGGGASAKSENTKADAVRECGRAWAETCQDAGEVGTVIGVGLILMIGFFGFVFLSLIWFMTRPKPQPVYIVAGSEARG
jgi:hypothetical protein